jgi:hypothetical protein
MCTYAVSRNLAADELALRITKLQSNLNIATDALRGMLEYPVDTEIAREALAQIEGEEV